MAHVSHPPSPTTRTLTKRAWVEQFFRQNPSVTAKDVCRLMGVKGLTVSREYANEVLKELRTPTSPVPASLTVKVLFTIQDLARDLGGVGRLKEAVSLYERLTGK